ncbi:uncharacterized protein LOC143623124 [Bidens hawaiensis]|uniref:uncharacterized protein LOC143623124 n=1 Tax=Bidens hawaiensis TaxID=980011 RepID=UPI0040498D62
MVENGKTDGPINEYFPDEHILAVSQNPWFAHIVNFKVAGDLPEHWPRRKKKQLMTQAKQYIWDDPDLFKIGADQMIRRCIPKEDVRSVLEHAHSSACGEARKLALCEIEELRDEAYDCASAYKAKMKKVHDANIRLKNFEVGQRVWLYNTRMKLFPGKLKSKWTGPYLIVRVGNHGQYEIEDFDDHLRQVVNGYRLKPYLEMKDIHELDKESVNFIVTSLVYEDN